MTSTLAYDPADRNDGGPHDHLGGLRDFDGRRMDGFIRQSRGGRRLACTAQIDAPICSLDPRAPDVVVTTTGAKFPTTGGTRTRSCSRTNVPAGHPLELAGAPVHALRLVGPVRAARRVSCDLVSKTFGSTVAVHDLSIDIVDGEFLVLVGPSGCGKTTGLRMLAGLEDVSSGRVFFGDPSSTT